MNHKKIVIKWKEFEIPKAKLRLIDINTDIDFIITISGPRRAGKTYLCFQTIQNLLAKSISKENIFYINFEDNLLLRASADDLDKMLEYFEELSDKNQKQKLYLFLDEIQVVKDWDTWARKIHDQRKDIKLILTGSSSKLLSKEISSKLRGRVINKEVFPLSFKEVLAWNSISYNIKTLSHSKTKITVKKIFSNYLSNGGFPSLLIDKSLQKEEILQSYYDSMIFKDIIERYSIKDVKKLKSLGQLLFQSVASEMSYSSLANKMTSIGFKISKNTIIEYISYFEDAYLFFQNIRYEYSISKQLGAIKKLYCVDNGLLNSVSFKFSDDTGKLIENLVYIELLRRKQKVYLHHSGKECEFLVIRKNKVASAIQVTKMLNDENEKREINGLMEAIKIHNLKEGIIITEDQEEERVIEGKKINIIPIWKWLLD